MGACVSGRKPKGMSRRDFLAVSSMAAAGWIAGCAANPVTGKRQLMLVSEEEEIRLDRQSSPFQISSDYGPAQDNGLQGYVREVGRQLAGRTHRTHMPYSFSVVNAVYVNAYAFPGGTVACTRGILLSLDNEAELAALLSHELGHVNARHTASAMSRGKLTQALIGGASAVAGLAGSGVGQVASSLGMVGAGALLARYSRDNEREADALGMEYMVRTGYGPQGMIGLMDMLRGLSKNKPGAIELMFSTHPMSEERHQAALANSRTRYASVQGLLLNRERYMDHTAGLRSTKGAVEALQKGEQQMGREKFGEAETHFHQALGLAPEDYAGLALMGTCQIFQKKFGEAVRFLDQAKAAYPQEAQAYFLSGFARLQTKEFSGAYQDFSANERLLPGNPTVIFFKGFAQENMGNRPDASQEYQRYLNVVQEGKYAQHAYQRLTEWGYIKKK